MTEREVPNWNEYFLAIAKLVATKSNDRSTQVGAVLVGKDHSVLSVGFNGMPRGINDLVASRHVRPDKLYYFAHAELNLITNCARNGIRTEGTTIYISSLPPCADCARAIIQAGIIKVVCTGGDIPERWKESCSVGREMLEEAKVEISIV